MTNRFFGTLFLVFTCLVVNSQSSAPQSKANYPRIIPPSPEAAALGKFGDIPISLFSGIPQVEVPLYSLQSGDININVKLAYNASGVRVGDIATNVGLGWSLYAGGLITRSVQGIPDFVNDGFPPNENNFTPNANLSDFSYLNYPPYPTSDYFIAKDIITSNRDTEKDIYYYNFLGNSGKFVFDSLARPFLIPANPAIKILPYNGVNYLSGFIIIDDKGFKYSFSATESLVNVTNPCNLGVESSREYTSNFPSAWYLTKIESTTGRVVNFEYESYTYTVKRSYKEVSYIRKQIVDGCSDLAPNNRQCTRIETIQGLRIKRIVLGETNNNLVFDYSASNRLDLTYNGQNSGNYLQSVHLERSGVSEKYWYLSYGYFSAGSFPRLKLLSVQEGNKPPYEFTYNETNPLPDRLAFSQDHWGYYNGKQSNAGLIPAIPEIGVTTGADRSPDFNYMQSASLIKLKYPTGGYTQFIYEPHTDMVTEDSMYFVSEGASLVAQANTGGSTLDQSFTLPLGATDIFFNWDLRLINYDDNITGEIVDANNTSIVYKLVNVGVGGDWIYNLTPGQSYILRIIRVNNADVGNMNISWKKPVTAHVTHNKIIYGGLRIKSLRNYDIRGELIGKKLYYYNTTEDSTKSTAILPDVITPVYWDEYQVANSTSGNNNILVAPCGYFVLSSSSRPELGAGLDVAIGYQQVIETDTSSAVNGRTIYKYSRLQDFVNSSTTIQANGNYEWCKGMLLEKTIQKYDAATSTFKNVTKTNNYYKTLSNELCRVYPDSCRANQKIIQNFRINYKRPETIAGADPSGDPYVLTAYFIVEKYFVLSNWVFLDRSEDTVYDQNSTRTVGQATFYDYSSINGFPITVLKRDSKNNLIETQTKYPQDFVGSSVYDSMIKRNIISPSIDVKNFNNSVLVSENKTNYGLWQSNTIVNPSNIQVTKGAVPLASEIVFDAYDNKGNLLQFTGKDGLVNSFVWGYHQNYPVAKIIGVNYANVLSAINQTDQNLNYLQGLDGSALLVELDKIRTNVTSIYPQAQVFTYTYAPLIGMLSEIDPNGRSMSYEYDELYRLKNIKDYQGNIVKNFQYNYANSCGNNCYVLTMQTFTGYNTPSYPVGVFNINKQYIGTATSPSTYVSLWNSNATNQAIGVLSTNSDSLHFNLSLTNGATLPSAVYGLRYYQWDVFSPNLVRIGTDSLSFVDWGDGNKELITATRLKMYDTVPYGYMNQWLHRDFMYYWVRPTHQYSSQTPRTITVFHNETTEMVDITYDGINDTTQNANIRGYYPEKLKGFVYDMISNSSDTAVKNFNKLTELVNAHYQFYNSTTTKHNNWQKVNNSHKMQWLKIAYKNGLEIADSLRANFPLMVFFEAQDYKPNISTAWGQGGFPNMYVIIIGLTSGSLTASEADTMLNNQVTANTIINGVFAFGPWAPRTTASNAAYNTFVSRGWTLSFNSPQ